MACSRAVRLDGVDVEMRFQQLTIHDARTRRENGDDVQYNQHMQWMRDAMSGLGTMFGFAAFVGLQCQLRDADIRRIEALLEQGEVAFEFFVQPLDLASWHSRDRPDRNVLGKVGDEQCRRPRCFVSEPLRIASSAESITLM